jgi:hypothetical protein
VSSAGSRYSIPRPTTPLLDFYRDRATLVTLYAVQSPDPVSKAIRNEQRGVDEPAKQNGGHHRVFAPKCRRCCRRFVQLWPLGSEMSGRRGTRSFTTEQPGSTQRCRREYGGRRSSDAPSQRRRAA